MSDEGWIKAERQHEYSMAEMNHTVDEPHRHLHFTATWGEGCDCEIGEDHWDEDA